jgi:hypothetical protein
MSSEMGEAYWREIYSGKGGREAFRDRVNELQLQPQVRDDARPITDYPRMPPGTCYLSSLALAECYPELEVRYGTLRWLEGGMLYEIPHAWNVVSRSGTIVDSTWTHPISDRKGFYEEYEKQPSGKPGGSV